MAYPFGVLRSAETTEPTGSPVTMRRMLPLTREVEDHDRELVVHAERDGGGVHHLQAAVEHLDVAHARELHRRLVLGRIGGVDAVHLGGLEDHLRADLHRAQRPRGIGGEEWIARARREDDHAALLEVADGPPPDVGLGHRPHLDGREHAGGHPRLLDGILQGQRVDHGGEHAHVVAGGPVHPARAGRDAAEDVAAPDDHRELHPQPRHLGELLGDAADDVGIDAVPLTTRQRLARDLEQDAPVRGSRAGDGHGWPSSRPPGSGRSASPRSARPSSTSPGPPCP